MKKLFTFAIILGISFAFLPSCGNWDSKQEFRINIATMKLSEGESFYFVLDDGRRLFPAQTAVRFTPRDNQRVILNFTELTGQHGSFSNLIRINDLWSVLTKQVVDLTDENAEMIGDDPVIINDMWVGGDFLNVSFRFNWGGVRPHYINLVRDTTIEEVSDAIELEFRHNAYGSTNEFNRDGLVSFDLRPFRLEEKDEVTFAIRVNEPTGKRVINVVYQFNPSVTSTTAPTLVNTSSEVY